MKVSKQELKLQLKLKCKGLKVGGNVAELSKRLEDASVADLVLKGDWVHGKDGNGGDVLILSTIPESGERIMRYGSKTKLYFSKNAREDAKRVALNESSGTKRRKKKKTRAVLSDDDQLLQCIAAYDSLLAKWIKENKEGKWVGIRFSALEEPVFASSEEEIWMAMKTVPTTEIFLVRQILLCQPTVQIRFVEMKLRPPQTASCLNNNFYSTYCRRSPS